MHVVMKNWTGAMCTRDLVPAKYSLGMTPRSTRMVVHTTFGTCDLCFSSGSLEQLFFTFEVSDSDSKTQVTLENGFWDWGDYLEIVYFDNVFKFIDWFNETGITVDKVSNIDERWLSGINNMYSDTL